MSSQIPRPRKSNFDMNKTLPPLPPEPRTSAFAGRSASWSVLRPPASAPLPRNRDVSCDFPNLMKLRADLQLTGGDEEGDRDEEEDEEKERHVCKINSLIKSPGEPITDDPELYESSTWWAGRYTAISDRLRGEMPRATQEERDTAARHELYALCGGDTQKQRSLQIWFINFTIKQEQREQETRKQKAVV